MKGKQPGGNLRAVNWDRVRLEPFEKNFYNATRESQNADPRVVEKFRCGKVLFIFLYTSKIYTCRHENEIAIMRGEQSCPNPIFRWEDGGFPDYVMKEVRKLLSLIFPSL